MIRTIEEATQTLTTAMLDVEADGGNPEDMMSDLVEMVAEDCDRSTANELRRRNGFRTHRPRMTMSEATAMPSLAELMDDDNPIF